MTADLEPLPHLRRKRRFDLPKLVGRFSEGVAEIDSQVENYHQQWADANEVARRETGPLWVVLGDSSSQGVGASRWENGWTHTVLDRLREASGEPWRLVNLSMSGGRFLDVADRQVPVLNTMLDAPQLVTCVVGSNDLMWRRRVHGITTDADRVVDRLPPGAFVSKLNGPGPRPTMLNNIFKRGADTKDHQLFNIWNWPSGRGALAADRVHPSDVGYQHMTELAWSALEQGLGL
ncbi:MAG: lysophospholipase L1-like esterase [Acidimicrobiales bacterium]